MPHEKNLKNRALDRPLSQHMLGFIGDFTPNEDRAGTKKGGLANGKTVVSNTQLLCQMP